MKRSVSVKLIQLVGSKTRYGAEGVAVEIERLIVQSTQCVFAKIVTVNIGSFFGWFEVFLLIWMRNLVVVCHTPLSAFLMSFILRPIKLKIIYFIHCDLESFIKRSRFHGFLIKTAIKNIQNINVNNDVNLRFLKILIPDKKVFFSGNKIREFDGRRFFSKKSNGVSPIRIGYLGRMQFQDKRFDRVIKIGQRYSEDLISIVAMGSGELYGVDVHRIKYFQYSDDVESFFTVIDCLVVPSDSETVANVIPEALLHGVPVVIHEELIKMVPKWLLRYVTTSNLDGECYNAIQSCCAEGLSDDIISEVRQKVSVNNERFGEVVKELIL